MKRTVSKEEKEQYTELLKKWCPVGKTIYSQFIQTGGNGIRTFTFYTVVDGEIYVLDYAFTVVLGYQFRETTTTARGIRTSDPFSPILHLSYHLFGIEARFDGSPCAYTHRTL